MRARTLLAASTALVVCACRAAPVRPSPPADRTHPALGPIDRPAPSSPLGSTRAASEARDGRGWSSIPKGDTLDLALRLDLGSGQAPYDDAPPDNALLPEGARGFSDSLLQVVIEGQVSPGLSLEGALAAIRFQDEPLLEGLRQVELAWVAIGIRWRF